MKIAEMNFAEWIRALDDCGSSDDVIYYGGVETTPNRLAQKFRSLDRVRGVRIEYFGGDNPRRRIAGTAGGMLRERRSCASISRRR